LPCPQCSTDQLSSGAPSLLQTRYCRHRARLFGQRKLRNPRARFYVKISLAALLRRVCSHSLSRDCHQVVYIHRVNLNTPFPAPGRESLAVRAPRHASYCRQDSKPRSRFPSPSERPAISHPSRCPKRLTATGRSQPPTIGAPSYVPNLRMRRLQDLQEFSSPVDIPYPCSPIPASRRQQSASGTPGYVRNVEFVSVRGVSPHDLFRASRCIAFYCPGIDRKFHQCWSNLC